MIYRPFFFWVHRTLPLVYDDSLSYMELLSKVLFHLNKNIEKTNEISKLLAQLTEYINKFYDSDEFKTTLEEVLDEMAEDGTLDTMLSEIANSTKFIPTDEEHDAYVNGVAAGIVSYLVHMCSGTCSSVVGTPTNTLQKFAAKYCDDYSVIYPNLLTYDAIVDNEFTFGKWVNDNNLVSHGDYYDSVTVGGVSYPVMYMNCSGFATLLTKGRAYAFSPWYELYTNAEPTGKELALKALEYGDMHEAPWTVDFMNTLYTWRMASVMRGSGCIPKKIVSKSGSAVTYEDAIDYLRDGDIIFFGNPNNGNYSERYLNVHHCAIYFKTLTKLNEAASYYGVSVKAWDDSVDSDNHGYVVHCTTGSDGTYGINNVFRIDTLDSYMSRTNDGEVLYGCQISANALNSGKQYLAVSGRMPLYLSEVVTGSRHNYLASGTNFNYNSVIAMTSGSNNGEFSYGQYRYAQPTSSIIAANGEIDLDEYIGPKKSGVYVVNANNVTVTHGPTSAEVVDGDHTLTNPTSNPLLLEVKDCYSPDSLTLQSLTMLTATPHKWERTINYVGTSSNWKEIY